MIARGTLFAAALAAVVSGDMTARGETPTSIRIGYAISLSGPNAPSSLTVLPNYRLWVKEVNAAGGILLRSAGKRVPIEVVEYDDQSDVGKTLAALQRLITVDKVDLILAPAGTGLNLGVASLLNSAGYPHLAVQAFVPEAGKLWPNSFWFLGTMTGVAQGFVETIAKLRSEGKIGNTVAMLSVADQLGIGLAKAARSDLKKQGFDIVYDHSYPVGAPDMSAMISKVKQLNPDSFVAFSLPDSTIALTERAQALSFNPKVFYLAIGTSFQFYKQRFGTDVEGVMGPGGWYANTPKSKAYLRRFVEATGDEPERWGSPVTYASLQMLQEAVERVGKIDRAAVIKELQTGTFETIIGQIKLENNLYKANWLVGQWQNGEFHAIYPSTLPGARPIMFPKPVWRGVQ
jgi:branched-chain amino acid transport system substrate-binding protein